MIAAASLLASCTSLSTREDLRPPAGTALTGVPYSLPMLQYDLAITRSLAQCVDPLTQQPHVRFTMTVEATPHYPAGETYVIDYRKLAGWTKITALTIEFQENSNILKSVNASAEDRTGAIIGNSVKSALGIASIIGGIPAVPGAAPGNGSAGMMICVEGDKGGQAKLDAVTLATDDVTAKTGKLRALTEAVDSLSARQSALSDSDRADLTKKVTEQRAAIKALAKSNEALAEANLEVGYTVKTSWPRSLNETDKRFPANGPGLARIASLIAWKASDGSANAKDNRCDDQAKLAECIAHKLKASAMLSSSSEDTRKTADETFKDRPTVQVAGVLVDGLLVRPPIRGRLLVCAATDAGCAEGMDQLVFRSDDVAIPQLGSLRFLPFRNEAFQNNALILLVTPSGELAKVEYKNIKAQGEELSATVLGAVNDLRGFMDARTKQQGAEEKAAHDALAGERADEIGAIQFEIDKGKKQKELIEATTPTADNSGIVSLQAQTAEINARVALLQAQLAERQARAALEQ
jgi:hypothetical protein